MEAEVGQSKDDTERKKMKRVEEQEKEMHQQRWEEKWREIRKKKMTGGETV